MGKSKFEEFLQEENIETVKNNWDEKKEFFIKKVNEFYKQMDSFLVPHIKSIVRKSLI